MKVINNAVPTDYELRDLRSEGQILADEDADEMFRWHVEGLKSALSDLEWIFDCFEVVESRYIDRYEELMNELPENERDSYEPKFNEYFGSYGLRWEYELGWDA